MGMKISLISFTQNGANLGHLLSMFLDDQGYDTSVFTAGEYAKGIKTEAINKSLREWTKEQFEKAGGIVFIGATGIAVRAIAPFIEDKLTDPAILVIDEKGKFVIPLLSGHIGGANELAHKIAIHLGTIPVITTATDINQMFAVDLFAKKNNLYISRMDYAKAISATILNGKQVGFASEFPVSGFLPDNIMDKNDCDYGISISLNEKKELFEKTLILIPKIITLGIGCRKGKTADEIENVVLEVLGLNRISPHSISKVASIDLKKEEVGLLEFCDRLNLKLITYSAEMLEKVDGIYSESDYVKSVAGVGNVCERAAILSSGNGIMVQKKYAKNGVTVCIAKQDWSVTF